jgi:HEAT repeat protein
VRIYCTRCWADNDPGASRCRACGADLIEQQREDEQMDFSAKLVRALRHGTPEIPVIAAEILGKRRDVNALQPLSDLVKDPRGEPYARAAAAQALAEIGDRSAIPALIAALDSDAFVIVRAAAAEALARLGGPDAARRLAQAVHDPTERPRIRAIAESSVRS